MITQELIKPIAAPTQTSLKWCFFAAILENPVKTAKANNITVAIIKIVLYSFIPKNKQPKPA